MKHVVVGTAGHIDHGKSALVRALTGIDPDRLAEEQRRGITIDLGFAHLRLGEDLSVAFVDVPGHERFIKNMLAGATGIDLVMLVVAADESVKPQTREHFDICRLLGVRQGLVSITKCDLVERDAVDTVLLEVSELIAGSFLENAPLVPTSARTGEGLDNLKAALRHLGLAAPSRATNQPFRLPIDRSFTMKGFGTVITGTVATGSIEKEAEVEILPPRRRARIRGIEVHNQRSPSAFAGQRTALNLAGIEACEIRRGMTAATAGLFEPSARLDCALSLLPSARPLKNRARVHFHSGTMEAMAEVVLLEGSALEPGGRAYAQLRLAQPGLFLPGDKMVIRQFSPVVTMGGGTVLDPHPVKHDARDGRVRPLLQILEEGDAEARLGALVSHLGEETAAALAARTGWWPADVVRRAKLLGTQNRIVILGNPAGHLVDGDRFRLMQEATLDALTRFHEANPLVSAISREELRNRAIAGARPLIGSAASFNAVLEALVGSGKIRIQGEGVTLAGRGVQLSAEEAAAKEAIGAAFERAGLTVPPASDVLEKVSVDRARAEKILKILIQEKTLLRVADGLIFHRNAIEKVRALLKERKTKTDRLEVPAFKEMTGLSRKYAIPLLEYLDRARVTRREGDHRVIL